MARVLLTGSCFSRSWLRLEVIFMLTQHSDVTAARSSLSKLLQSKTDSEFQKLSLTMTSLDSRMRE